MGGLRVPLRKDVLAELDRVLILAKTPFMPREEVRLWFCKLELVLCSEPEPRLPLHWWKPWRLSTLLHRKPRCWCGMAIPTSEHPARACGVELRGELA